MNKHWCVVLGLLGSAACNTGPAEDQAAGQQPVVVDSILPIEIALHRFREGLQEVARLTSGAPTRDALVAELATGLAHSDTLALERLAVTRAEYAWLYYPTTAIARPPYELPPALAWFQLQEGNRKGALRLLRDLGGRTNDLLGYSCAADPMTERDNRIWTGCLVELRVDGGPASQQRLFAAILERDGQFAFLSFHNDF